jgi:hypothetical protein
MRWEDRMAVFVVISQGGQNSEKLPGVILQAFPTSNLQLNDKAWLVSGPVTAKSVSDSIGLTKGDSGTGVVLQFAGDYFGLASPGVWAWIKATVEASRG